MRSAGSKSPRISKKNLQYDSHVDDSSISKEIRLLATIAVLVVRCCMSLLCKEKAGYKATLLVMSLSLACIHMTQCTDQDLGLAAAAPNM